VEIRGSNPLGGTSARAAAERTRCVVAGRPERPRGVVRITLADEPALYVCNEGDPLPAEVVLHSLGKCGESSKLSGSGIGYKGIGFKSVLEICLTPQVFSRGDPSGSWDISAGFSLSRLATCSTSALRSGARFLPAR